MPYRCPVCKTMLLTDFCYKCSEIANPVDKDVEDLGFPDCFNKIFGDWRENDEPRDSK